MTDCSLMIIMATAGKFSMIWTGNRMNLSFTGANDMCKCLFHHTLASIHSKNENDIITDMMIDKMILPDPISTEFGKDDLLIGLNKIEDPTKWTWADGSSVDYTNWEQDFKIEPDPTDFRVEIERQGSFTWWGRGRPDGDNNPVVNTRWFLCDNGQDPIEFDDNDDMLLFEILIPSLSGGLVLCMGFCVWVLKRFFNIIIFKCCDLRLERTSEGSEGEEEVELSDEIIGDAEIIIDNA